MLPSRSSLLRTWVSCRPSSVRRCCTKSQHSSSPFVDCLRNHGFPDDTSQILLTRMQDLKLGETQLNKTLVSWGSCQFGQDKLTKLLSTNPSLLLADAPTVISGFTFLSSYFSLNYVYKILLNSPDVLWHKQDDVSAKLDFLKKSLGLSNAQIVKSNVLSHPLSHLRTRYEFLKRSGAYKLVSGGPKGATAQPALSNPSVDSMFDTTDAKFAKQVARLSLLEFDVFSNLYNEETSKSEQQPGD